MIPERPDDRAPEEREDKAIEPPEAIRVEGLSKLYRRTLPGDRLRTLKSALVGRSLASGLKPEESIAALEQVDFSVHQGEAFGVIGGNGSGKSTLLKLAAGMLKPTTGRIINGAVLGLPRKLIASRYEEIVEFAGLGDFMEEPVKNYSSGMYVRLGFAVAVNTDPDVLLVDEVLAVGDEAFAHRCLRRIEEFLAAGKTLLLVSHSLDLVEGVCDRVLWLENGHQRLVGEPRRVIDAYRQEVAEREGEEHREARKQREQAGGEVPEELRWGSRDAEIVSLRLIAGGEERYHVTTGEDVTFEIRARAGRPLDDFVFGVAISTPRDHEVWGTNTDIEGYAAGHFEGDAVARLTCPGFRLAPGEYVVDVAIHSKEGVAYDYQRRALTFTVTATTGGVGVYFPEHRWEFSGGLEWKTSTNSPGG
jgi:lipopolysaccharide transport system ATP-binding protein